MHVSQTLMLLAIVDLASLGATLVPVVIWTLIASVLLVLAMKLFDLMTPGKLHEQVFRDKNVAAAIVYGAALVAFAIVICASMH